MSDDKDSSDGSKNTGNTDMSSNQLSIDKENNFEPADLPEEAKDTAVFGNETLSSEVAGKNWRQ